MRIHFVGIGGTAMGSVAIACKNAGYAVTGSDEALYPPMSTVLEESGISIYYHYDAAQLAMISPDITIIGNAISRGNPELEYVLNNRLPMSSMAQFVGEHFIDRHTSIVVAGTHGKTTTSTIAAHILEHCGKQPGYMIGGVPVTLESGCRMVPPSHRNTTQGVFVSEGDEYDTAFFDKRSKFIHYRPTIAILNNLEFDHADIFDSVQDIIKSFSHLVRIVPSNGCVLANADDANVHQAVRGVYAPCDTVGLSDDATWRIDAVTTSKDGTSWTVVHEQEGRQELAFAQAGLHNVRNATMAAIATKKAADLSWDDIRSALMAYQLPKRRLEHIGTWLSCDVIDDFAHHPTAIKATIKAIGQSYPDAHIHACFEPRSNTTTRAFFQHELATCFDGARTVFLGPVNRPERYKAEERLDTDTLMAELSSLGIESTSLPPEMSSQKWGIYAKEWFASRVQPGDVVLLLSNGNLGGLRQELTA